MASDSTYRSSTDGGKNSARKSSSKFFAHCTTASLTSQTCNPRLNALTSHFLAEYQTAGIVSSSYAAVGLSTLLGLFIVFGELSNKTTNEATTIRIGMLCILLFYFVVALKAREFLTRNYVWIVAGTASLLLAGLLAILTHPNIEAQSQGFSTLPALYFSLFLLYGFLRIPIRVSILIGSLFSIASLWVISTEFNETGEARAMLYLLSFNVMGVALALSIERRERRLFDQREELQIAHETARKRANESEARYIEKNQLVAAINHDLRYPVTAAASDIHELHELVANQSISLAAQDILSRLSEKIRYISTSLDHLLAVARHDGNQSLVHIEEIELEPLLTSVIDACEHHARENNVRIHLIKPDHRVVAVSDRGHLAQIIQNLLTNAISAVSSSASGSKRLVRIRFGSPGGFARIIIRDTGGGLAGPVAFPPGDSPRTEKLGRQSGTHLGIGLTLVHSAIRRLTGHKLRAFSKPAAGCAFSLTLPGRRLHGEDDIEFCSTPLSLKFREALESAYILLIAEDPVRLGKISDLLRDWQVTVCGGTDIAEVQANFAQDGRLADAIIAYFRNPLPENLIQSLKAIVDDSPPIVMISEINTSIEELAHAAELTSLHPPFPSETIAMKIIEGIRRNREREESASS